MQLTPQILHRIGAGEQIATVCDAEQISASEFDSLWKQEIASRVFDWEGTVRTSVGQTVQLDRDRWGIPHVKAETQGDLFFGFGYVLASDRLFQLDYLRRKASGRLSEILGPDGLQPDTVARTVGLRQIAEREWEQLPDSTRRVLESFSAGINAWMGQCSQRPPIEFDLLDYRPDPWSPIDSLAIEVEFRWYLTGRLPVIAIPELARRVLGAGKLYEAFLLGEADEESILPPAAYDAALRLHNVGSSATGADDGTGSNNWVIDGTRSGSGKPLVGSDPHIAFEAVSCWYEVHLTGGPYNVCGMAYVGMPVVLFGRNEQVAWGCTNNICSQRDLYQEKTAPEHPGCFLYDGNWEPAGEREETIRVKDAKPVRLAVRSSRHGPIVDAILPEAARDTGPVSLRWLGTEHGGWLTAMLAMNQAPTAEAFRAAAEPWHVPTWCVVFADTQGNVGYLCTGRIPIRQIPERGYRPGWLSEHEWNGLIPFESMPQWQNPERGWIATANNRVAPNDFPFPLAGTWTSGQRARRARQMIEGAQAKLTVEDFGTMHQDSVSLRAIGCVPGMLKVLGRPDEPVAHAAVEHLQAWDGRMETDSVAASIFVVFFQKWCDAVARQRFPEAMASLIAGAVGGLASRLLTGDDGGWFAPGRREPAVKTVFRTTVDLLTNRLGPDVSRWQWGSLHRITLRHVLSGRGELARLLDLDSRPIRGEMTTVCNTGCDANLQAVSGGGYRLIADLASDPPGLWAIDGQSQSGQPGSPHYADQLDAWLAGKYHFLPLRPTDRDFSSRLTLAPK